jgi:hypothetical protein
LQNSHTATQLIKMNHNTGAKNKTLPHKTGLRKAENVCTARTRPLPKGAQWDPGSKGCIKQPLMLDQAQKNGET